MNDPHEHECPTCHETSDCAIFKACTEGYYQQCDEHKPDTIAGPIKSPMTHKDQVANRKFDPEVQKQCVKYLLADDINKKLNDFEKGFVRDTNVMLNHKRSLSDKWASRLWIIYEAH